MNGPPSRPAGFSGRLVQVGVLVILVALLAGPAIGHPDSSDRLHGPYLERVSSSVAFRYYLSHPAAAPAGLRDRVDAIRATVLAAGPAGAPADADRFNLDDLGLPQNEESVAVLGKNVLSGTNDYRGLLDPEGNFTGWHLSRNKGDSVLIEGLLPPVDLSGTPTPSGGDPVFAAGGGSFYGASLAYDPFDPFGPTPNGIAIYRSDPARLAACGGGPDPSCWDGAAAAETVGGEVGHFFDKEWMAVGETGDGLHVWVVFTDFNQDLDTELGFTSAQIRAVRCDGDLTGCTAPILISGSDADVQFGDVTVGPDQRTYVTWAEIRGELEGTAQTWVIKMRVAEPGSTDFGPTRQIVVESRAIPFGGFLHASDFRVATVPKHDVALVEGEPRVFVTWERCTDLLLDFICAEPQVLLARSDDLGETWRIEKVSAKGDNYFPTLDVDPETGQLVMAWYTNRNDTFHHRYQVEVVTLGVERLDVRKRQFVGQSNEPDADYLLTGFFIGDYFEVQAHKGRTYVAYNANYAKMPLLGEGPALFQQDNYLTRVSQ